MQPEGASFSHRLSTSADTWPAARGERVPEVEVPSPSGDDDDDDDDVEVESHGSAQPTENAPMIAAAR